MMERVLKLPFGTVYIWNSMASEAASATDYKLLEINYYGLPLIMAVIFTAVLVIIIVLVLLGSYSLGNATSNTASAYLVSAKDLFVE